MYRRFQSFIQPGRVAIANASDATKLESASEVALDGRVGGR